MVLRQNDRRWHCLCRAEFMLAEAWQFLEAGVAREARALAAPWAELVARAAEPAARNHPDFVLPLLAAMPGAAVLTAAEPALLLLLLLALPARRLSRPLTMWSNLVTPLANGGPFHADAEQGPSALKALLVTLGAPLLLQALPAEGPLWDSLTAAGLRVEVLRRWRRAALPIAGDFESWYTATIDGKRRKEFRRLRARLAEQGELQLQSLAADDAVSDWTEDFLRLEAAGWKGARGTALAQQPGLAAALQAIAGRFHRRQAIRFWRLRLDGRTVAALFAVIEKDRAWLGKIAYDQAYARFSPGVLLMLDVTRALFAEPGLRLVDSCAIPDHPMIDHLWRDRLPVADVLLADRRVGALRFGMVAATERLRRRLRDVLRPALRRLTGRKRS
jgi:CelD/BcsL family acetyltransferase involved in cellulose biosynthesis